MKEKSYPLNGADRFQLYFDSVARKKTGVGNVIRAAVSLEGIISEQIILKGIEENKWMYDISRLTLRRSLFSQLYKLESESVTNRFSLTFHKGSIEETMDAIHSKDCDLEKANPSMFVDVVYGDNQTHLIISVSHILMDHTGMENLLSLLSGDHNIVTFARSENKKPLSKKLSDAFAATKFVASLSGWSVKRLAGTKKQSRASFELLELSQEETLQVKKRITGQALPFLLGSTVYSLSRHKNLLTGKNYFVPVPLDRRNASDQNSILSNFISFLYFKAEDSDLASIEKITEVISKQTISQARKNHPGKFSSLLDIFRYVPNPLYATLIELPSAGHAATFAFSLLSNSKLEGKKIFGSRVLDVTHFAPVISPPGLNVIFSEFGGRMKVLCSYDECRILKEDVGSFLNTLKLNLLG
jgi:NRPS condensation-like uncharacterized protein